MKHRLAVAVSLLVSWTLGPTALAQPAPEPSAEAAPTRPAEAGAPSEAAEAQPLTLEPPADEDAGDEAALDAVDLSADTIVVTGTHLRRPATFAPSAPVQVLEREQLERSGATNMGDVVGILTAAQGSGFQGGGSAVASSSGTAAVNLRGLGMGATLVLINGRRLVPSGGGIDQSFGDLSIMPLAAVERIEVLKGGGSALYGADAVGGVINIITRRRWEGFRTEVQGQSTTDFDQHDYTISAVWGALGEKTRTLMAFSHFDRSELTADQRPFSRGRTVSIQGHPGTFLLPGLGPVNPATGRPGALWVPDPGCARAPGSATLPVPGGEVCAFEFGKYWPLIPSLQRTNLFASAEYDVSAHATVYGEVLGSRMRTDGIASPSYPLAAPPTVPADHVDNPFGRPVLFLGRPLGITAGGRRNAAGDDSLRLLAGVRGDLGGLSNEILSTFEWNVHASWGTSRYAVQLEDTLREPLQQALDSCSDPSDLSRCYNPFFSAVDGTGTPNAQPVIDRILGRYTYANDHALQTYNAGMNGLLFRLPGGEVGLALGAEVRRESRRQKTDHDAEQQGYGFFIGNSDAQNSRRIYSGYVELLWPIVRGLELQTALRVEHYTDIGETAPSPFGGLTLTPADVLGRARTPRWLHTLQLRAQLTSAFRAPTVFQSARDFAVVPTPLLVGGTTTLVPVQAFGTPTLEPERALVASAGLSWQPLEALALTGTFWHYDYRDRIVVENAQQVLAADEAQMRAGGSDPRVIRTPSGTIERIQVKQINIDGSVLTRGIDFGATVTLTGESFGRRAGAWGALALGVQGTYTLSYRLPRTEAGWRVVAGVSPSRVLPPLHCKGDTCEAAGSRNLRNFAPPIPRWRLHFPVTYTNAGHALTLIGHYTSTLEDDNDVHADGSLGRLDAWVTYDLQYGYTFRGASGRELGVRIGVYNVADTLPPKAVETGGVETLLYDPRGRMGYAKIVGAF